MLELRNEWVWRGLGCCVSCLRVARVAPSRTKYSVGIGGGNECGGTASDSEPHGGRDLAQPGDSSGSNRCFGDASRQVGSPKARRGRAETPPPTCPQTSSLHAVGRPCGDIDDLRAGCYRGAGCSRRGPTQHHRRLPKVGCCIGTRWIKGPCLHARMSGRSTVQGRTGFSR